MTRYQVWFSDGNDRHCEAQFEAQDMKAAANEVLENMVRQDVRKDLEEEGDGEFLVFSSIIPCECGVEDCDCEPIIESYSIDEVDTFSDIHPAPYPVITL